MMNWMRAAIATVTAVVAMGMIGPAGRAGEFVWLEGEAGQANVKVNNAGWGNAQFLSEGQWMHISFEADKVEAEVKADAVRHPVSLRDQEGRQATRSGTGSGLSSPARRLSTGSTTVRGRRSVRTI